MVSNTKQEEQLTTATPPAEESATNTYAMPSTEDLKERRLKELRGNIEQELQKLVVTASSLRKKITESKTTTKRQYYDKKFSKVSTSVRQLVATLQQLNYTKEKENDNTAPVVE